MTEAFSDTRWNAFKSSGRVADYLYYKGIGVKTISSLKGENADAHNDSGCGDIGDAVKGK